MYPWDAFEEGTTMSVEYFFLSAAQTIPSRQIIHIRIRIIRQTDTYTSISLAIVNS